MNGSGIICVTGGSGMVGSHIVMQLLKRGARVRALSRSKQPERDGLEWFNGSLDNTKILREFMAEAECVFHCAAELRDTSKMHEVNVEGTRAVVEASIAQEVPVFCHISTVDVIGLPRVGVIDEATTPCPYSEYDRTKLEAEKIVEQALHIPKRVILRPANVFDSRHLKALTWMQYRRVSTMMRLLLQGNERPHLVYAGDVASAAIFLAGKETAGGGTFIVSCDDDQRSTYAGLYAMISGKDEPVWSCPALLPFLLRLIFKQRVIRGDTVYSSRKLLDSGFIFPFGLKKAVLKVLDTAL